MSGYGMGGHEMSDYRMGATDGVQATEQIGTTRQFVSAMHLGTSCILKSLVNVGRCNPHCKQLTWT